MAPSAADHLETMVGVALDPPHDGWEILPALRLEALDQIGAGFFIQCRVIAVVSLPDPAARRIHQFLDRVTELPDASSRKPVFPVGEEARCAAASDAPPLARPTGLQDPQRSRDFRPPCAISPVISDD